MNRSILMVISALMLTQSAVAQTPRIYLTKAQLLQSFEGKTVTMKFTQGPAVKYDVRAGGQIYFTNLSQRGGAATGSGTYEVKDDGGFCTSWNRTQNQGACSFYFKDGDVLRRTEGSGDAAAISGDVVSID